MGHLPTIKYFRLQEDRLCLPHLPELPPASAGGGLARSSASCLLCFPPLAERMSTDGQSPTGSSVHARTPSTAHATCPTSAPFRCPQASTLGAFVKRQFRLQAWTLADIRSLVQWVLLTAGRFKRGRSNQTRDAKRTRIALRVAGASVRWCLSGPEASRSWRRRPPVPLGSEASASSRQANAFEQRHNIPDRHQWEGRFERDGPA
jgi:hypothetical protein